MSNLNDIIKVGALQNTLKEISLNNYPHPVVTMSEFEAMDDEAKNTFNGIVTIDDSKWFATVKGLKPTLAKKLYSGNGGLKIGIWNRESKKFLLAEIIDGKTSTIKRITAPNPKNKAYQEKEKNDMADTKISREDLDLMDKFGTEELDKIQNDSTTPTTPAPAGEGKAEKEETAASKKRKENDAKIDQIRAKYSGQSLADRTRVVSKNFAEGKLMGFITKTDATVKVTKAQTDKLVAGEKVLRADATDDVKKKFENGEKVASKNYEKRYTPKLRNANPGAIIGAVIATPEAGRFDLNDLSDDKKVFSFDETKTDLKYSFHPLEQLYLVLSAWYDGKIKEDDTILGKKASIINVEYVMVKPKKDATGEEAEPKMRPKLSHNKDLRKSLLYPGNFFPIKIYETIDYQNLSEEDAASLNYNFAAMLKGDKGTTTLAEFNEVDPEFIKMTADGVTSKVFAPGASASGEFGTVPAYYDKDEILSEVKIAKRIKKVSEKGTVTYPFVYHKFQDEKGPLSVPAYKKVFDNLHIDESELSQAVSNASKSRSRVSGKKLTTTDFLQAALKGNGTIKGFDASVAQIQKNLMGIFD